MLGVWVQGPVTIFWSEARTKDNFLNGKTTTEMALEQETKTRPHCRTFGNVVRGISCRNVSEGELYLYRYLVAVAIPL